MNKEKKSLCEKYFDQPVFVKAGFIYIIISFCFVILGVIFEKTLYQAIIASYGALIIAWIAYNGATANVKYLKEKEDRALDELEKKYYPQDLIHKILFLEIILDRFISSTDDVEVYYRNYNSNSIIEIVDDLEDFLSYDKISKYKTVFKELETFKLVVRVFNFNLNRWIPTFNFVMSSIEGRKEISEARLNISRDELSKTYSKMKDEIKGLSTKLNNDHLFSEYLKDYSQYIELFANPTSDNPQTSQPQPQDNH